MTKTLLLTTREAAKILGVSPHTLSRWVAGRKIQPAAKAPGLRGAYLFRPSEVERVLTSRGEIR